MVQAYRDKTAQLDATSGGKAGEAQREEAIRQRTRERNLYVARMRLAQGLGAGSASAVCRKCGYLTQEPRSRDLRTGNGITFVALPRQK